MRSLSGASSISAPFVSRASRAIDVAWAQLVHRVLPVDPFFIDGWGNLEAVHWETDKEFFNADPPELQIKWEKIGEGNINNVPFEKLQGVFTTPHEERMTNGLPHESHTARVQLLQPRDPDPGTALVLHLAGTGDHGFGRRMHIGSPLLSQNIATLALESPFYGNRKPDRQQGSRLLHVSNLLTLGRATIMEGLCLLDWAHRQGYAKLGVTGLSMGGVHASMIGGLSKHEVAVSPHLTPRSGTVAFCEGAMNSAIAFQQLSEAEVTCEYILRVADSLRHKPDFGKIPPRIDRVAVARLSSVLETYTDITRYPCPTRSDAAIIVAATGDAYVSRKSATDIQQYWPGSEVRWIAGGHVTSVMLHTKSFRKAIVDSLDRL